MPSLQDIREFNDSLVRLADEPEIIRGWGEEVEGLPEPEEGLDTDLSSLLEDTGDLSHADESAQESLGEAPDFSAVLGEEPAGEPEPGGFPGEESPFGGFPEEETGEPSFESIFEEEGAEVPGGETTAEETPGGEAPGEGEVPSSDDEGPGNFDFGGLTDEFGSEEDFGPQQPPAVPEPAEPETAEAESTGAEVAEPESVGPAAPSSEEEIDFSDFEALLGSGLAETEAEPEAEAAPGGAEPSAGDEESFANLGTEDFGGEEFAAGEFGTEDFGAGELESEDFDAGEFDAGVFDSALEEGGEPLGPETPAVESEPFGPETPAVEGEPFATEPPGEEGEPFALPEGGELLGPQVSDTGAADLGELDSFEFSDEDIEPSTPGGDEDFSFEEPTVPGMEEPAFGSEAEAGEPGAEESEGELEEFDASDIDEFSLGDFGAEFGVLGEETQPSEEDLNPAISVPEVGTALPAAASTEFQIADSDFEALQETMAALPLNLRIEIEAIVNEAKGTTDQVEELLRRLASGQSPSEIAGFAGRIVGRQIRIPRGYEKRSGVEFEAERSSFAYQFRENILPVLRVVAVAAVALAVLILAGYHLVFRPLYARSLYREGLALIAEDQYTLGNQTFERAREVWVNARWFYSYAEAFIGENQYTLAAEKYEQLLFGMTREERDYFNGLLANQEYGRIVTTLEPEKQGILDFANLESEILGNYQHADRLLQLILVSNVADYDARLAIGDNYMLWAEVDPSHYEDARIAYARLMERYGQTDELLFRMLRYFVRTDNLEEVLRLRDLFEADERMTIEPDAYAEMAGYLIDKNRLANMEDLLFRALDTDRDIPEIHYQLARYYRLINADGEEDLALKTARMLLEGANPKTRRVRTMLVDTIIRQGENQYDAELYLDAQASFGQAITEYEEGLRRRVLQPAPMFGRAYAHFADILYYVGRQYDDALRYFYSAEDNGYSDANLDYKEGFILYRNEQFESALEQFRHAAEDPSASTNALIWATANTYYRRDNFFAAEAYYRELLDRVELQRDNIKTLLVDEDPSHRSVIEYLIRVNNNLGVTLDQLYEETGDPDYFSQSLIYLTESIEYSENYRRNPETMVRSNAVGLAFLNQRGILYPTPDYTLQIYNEMPEDLDALNF